MGLRSLPTTVRRGTALAALVLAAPQVSMALFQIPTAPTLPGIIRPLALALRARIPFGPADRDRPFTLVV